MRKGFFFREKDDAVVVVVGILQLVGIAMRCLKRAARSSCAGRASISLTVDVVIHKVLLVQLFNTILSLYPLCL
jgi:hypothetical protein